jgi:hypothetical protein
LILTKWETKGTIIITRNAFDDLLKSLRNMKEVLEREYWVEK